MSEIHTLLQLQEIDLLLHEAADPASRVRLARLGFELGDEKPLQQQRARIFAGVDRRWQRHYERAAMRYGRGIVGVRERVCQGCRITLPTSASPPPGDALTVCESCGRLLYWR